MIWYLKCLLLYLNKLMATGYFAMSIFQKTYIRCNFAVLKGTSGRKKSSAQMKEREKCK